MACAPPEWQLNRRETVGLGESTSIVPCGLIAADSGARPNCHALLERQQCRPKLPILSGDDCATPKDAGSNGYSASSAGECLPTYAATASMSAPVGGFTTSRSTPRSA
jgi:hypothetical protein